jgi:hypothetical protein
MANVKGQISNKCQMTNAKKNISSSNLNSAYPGKYRQRAGDK